MKEEWRKQMRQKMADCRKPAPKVAWAEVEKAVVAGRRPSLVSLFARRVAAAAAIALIAGGGLWLLFRGQHDDSAAVASLDKQAERRREQIQTAIGDEVARIVGSSSHPQAVKPATLLVQQPSAEPNDGQEPQKPEEAQETKETQETPQDPKPTEAPTATIHHPMPTHHHPKSSRLTAKLYLSNSLTGSNASNLFLSQIPIDSKPNEGQPGNTSSDGSDGMNGKDGSDDIDGKDGSDGMNENDGPTSPSGEDKTTETVTTSQSVHHRQPIRFGFSLRYQLNHNWSIESGIVVSQHTSDFTETSSTSPLPLFTSRQRLVYVGIPLYVSYRLWGGKRFNLYAVAGGTVEKMVWGRQENEVLTDNVLQSQPTQSVSIKPLQLSLDGAIGAEYKFSNRFSFYAEPGLGYYFDNGSSVSTIYQDHPLNFNLNLGLRIDLRP